MDTVRFAQHVYCRTMRSLLIEMIHNDRKNRMPTTCDVVVRRLDVSTGYGFPPVVR